MAGITCGIVFGILFISFIVIWISDSIGAARYKEEMERREAERKRRLALFEIWKKSVGRCSHHDCSMMEKYKLARKDEINSNGVGTNWYTRKGWDYENNLCSTHSKQMVGRVEREKQNQMSYENNLKEFLNKKKEVA